MQNRGVEKRLVNVADKPATEPDDFDQRVAGLTFAVRIEK